LNDADKKEQEKPLQAGSNKARGISYGEGNIRNKWK